MQVVLDSSVELENAFFEPTSNRHQTDRETTENDVESDAWGPNRVGYVRVFDELFDCQ